MRYFYSALIVTLLGLIFIFWLKGSLIALYTVAILSVLEISLSLDNAVVNAKTLNKMPEVWRRRFILWGMPIAVFGMRLVFPLVLVYCTTSLGFMQVLHTAMYEPAQYKLALDQGMPYINAFGGAFLWMVFLDFLFGEHERHWLPWIENNRVIRVLKQVPGISSVISLLIAGVLLVVHPLEGVALALIAGMFLHVLLHGLNLWFESRAKKLGNLVQHGLMGFIYLEVLDATFSFDGVIGAFAISQDIFIIFVGLGIGAMYVRSFTLLFVEKQTLKLFPYLDHGAHYAIGFLGLSMFIGLFHHVSEILTGSVGAILLILAMLSSWRERR